MINLLGGALSISSILSVGLGIFCYLKNKKAFINKIWALYCMSIGIYCLGMSSFIAAENKITAIVWIYIMHIGWVTAPVLFLHFIVEFLEISERRLLYILYPLNFFLIGLTYSPLFIETIEPKGGFNYWMTAGPLYAQFLIIFMGQIFYAQLLLFKSYSQATPSKRNQIRHILLGSLFFLCSAATNFFLALDVEIFPFGNYLIIIHIFIITYAIVRYNLMGIEIIFSRSIFLIFLGLIFVIYMIITNVLYPMLGYNFSMVITTCIIVGFISIKPSRKTLASLLDKAIYRGKFDYQDILQETSKKMLHILDLKELLIFLSKVMLENIEAEKISIFLYDEETSHYKGSFAGDIPGYILDDIILSRSSPLIVWLQEHKKIFFKENMESALSEKEFKSLYSDISRTEATLIAPLLYKNKLIGFLALGDKLKGKTYANRDIDIITNLANESTQAIINAQLFLGAITDGLTQLYHRRYLDTRLFEEINRAEVFKHNLSFILIDIDHFKEINDIYGHDVGDIVLQETASILKNEMRNIDVLCRYGGEELGIILCETSLVGAEQVAERVRSTIEKHLYKHNDLSLNLTISLGISTFKKGTSKEELIELADSGLYKAKREGRNCVRIGEIKI